MLAALVILATAGYVMYNPGIVKDVVPDQYHDQRRGQQTYYISQDYAPYIGQAQYGHPTLYQNPTWTPQAWNQTDYNTQAVLGRLVESGIIYNAYFEEHNRIPIVKVGPNFYHLSNQDKTNAMAYFNRAYNITDRIGTFYIKDWETDQTVGVYTRSGLFLN